MNEQNYSAQNIQVQEGLEAVRKRPGMYIGSTDIDGLHHLIYEIVDNSIDEALEGHCNVIDIVLHQDNSVTISDNGRGIPVDIHSDGKSALEIVMTKLHAGGKFSKDAYAISGGLHGVGCAVVNALSDWCVVTVYKNAKIYEQKYARGNVETDILEKGSCDKNGTTVSFLPDASIFKEVQLFDYDKLSHRFRELAFLVKNIHITIIDERDDIHKKDTFFSDRGIIDFVTLMAGKKKTILEEPLSFKERVEDSEDVAEVELAFNYLVKQETTILSFVNSINTREGGTHLEGFRASLTRTLNKYLKQNEKIAKPLKDESLQGVDTQTGLQAVLSIKVFEPTFSGQTKTKLSNREIRGIVESKTTEAMTAFLDHHPIETKKILEKCVQSALARIEGQKAYDNTIRKSLLSSTSLPGKLTDCAEKDPTKSEIFLVEGDSAGGSAKLGRDRNIQAILPLFGKPSNVEKMQSSIHAIQTNAKLQPIIASLGTSIGELFNIEKLRYHKVILMADADVDGSHIRTLLLTFFFRYMRPLIEEGYMYLAMPPLYKIKWGNGKNDFKYIYTDKERDSELLILKNEKKVNKDKIALIRYKGLGEMNADELWDTTMNPETRYIIKITMDDIVSADKTFTLLLGEEVAPRRQFIEENALKVANLDI